MRGICCGGYDADTHPIGYGATTFPALTEAITFEEDEDRAAYEAARLTQKLLELADDIAV